MAKEIFMFRHQSGGFLNEFVFGEPPTPQQTEAIKKVCAIRYGTKHGKSKEPYWLKVFRLPILTPHDIVSTKEEGDGSSANEAAVPAPSVNATGNVTPAQKR